MSETTEQTTTARYQALIREHMARADYWRRNLRLIAMLLAAWLAVAFLPILAARDLNQIEILTGFPLGYYIGAQGAPIAFVALSFAYAWRMGKRDDEYGFGDDA